MDKQHLSIITQGVDVWNQWRKENPNISPDLEAAELIKHDLQGANLSWVNLNRSDLRRANLQSAYFEHTTLCDACLQDANLQVARIEYSNF